MWPYKTCHDVENVLWPKIICNFTSYGHTDGQDYSMATRPPWLENLNQVHTSLNGTDPRKATLSSNVWGDVTNPNRMRRKNELVHSPKT